MPRFLFAFLGLIVIQTFATANTNVEFVQAHCVKCHGTDKQLGDIRLDDLPADPAKAAKRWEAVRDQIRDGLMPPTKEARPDSARSRAVVASLTLSLGTKPGQLPIQGNLIPHELLFGTPAISPAASQPRIWRVSPDAYAASIRPLYKEGLKYVNPFLLGGTSGFRDYSSLHSVDEAVTEVLMRNAVIIVTAQTTAGNNGSHREFITLMDPKQHTPALVRAAIKRQFEMAVRHAPTEAEVDRYYGLYETGMKTGDPAGSFKTVLQAIILRTDAVYRYELGSGAVVSSDRRMLTPSELEQAISLSIGNTRDPKLVTELTAATAKGEAALKETVAQHVRKAIADPKGDRGRAMRFFAEYFEHPRSEMVFKDPPHHWKTADAFHFEPQWLTRDTDHLIRHVLDKDRDVFRALLTTPLTFANYNLVEDKKTRVRNVPARASASGGKTREGRMIYGVESVYGFTEWPTKQPLETPDSVRIGVLMQPSWLAAWSLNFDNDPVRRGRWIREQLLGGTVADLPIGVVAMVPDDPHRTYRDRLTVTRDVKCWKCHQRMDELGLPFEEFDHYGRVRKTETVLDVEATAKNVEKKSGKSLGKVMKEVPLNTTGTIFESGDPKLDGPVTDARQMIRKIADSDLARQVFVRHVFRFYMGRNEALSDAKTLQEADKAYVSSNGSFQALLVSILTSDSFLYRTTVAPKGGSK